MQIISEIGLAHMGRLELAKRLIDESASADYVKFQIYNTDELINKDRDPERFKRFKERELTYDQLRELKEYAEIRGLKFLATPHTLSAFYLFKDLGVFKIGSGDRDEIVRKAVDTGKDVFISTGMRTHSEVLRLVQDYGRPGVTFMHCITMYPVLEPCANMGFINTLRRWCRRVGAEVGYSDHLPGTLGCEVAAALDVSLIEKHIKLDESTGQDGLCALDGKEFRLMCRKVRRIKNLIGSSLREYKVAEKENESWALKGRDGKRPYSS